MRKASALLCLIAAITCMAGDATSAYSGEATLRIGTASVEITPPLGIPMAGYFHTRLATGVHDPLRAKALYVQGDRTEIVLVLCDLIGVDRQTVLKARKSIRESLSIPEDNVLIAATHTHTGPVYYSRGAHSGGSNADDLSPMQRDYAEKLVQSISESARQAKAAAAPAAVFHSSFFEKSLSFNRRYRMKSGEVRMNPGRGNPEILRPAGPIDPEVSVLSFRPKDGADPFAVLVVFALHLDTVGGTQFSADFPYFMGRALQEKINPKVLSIFAMGTSGDINHIDVTNPNQVTGIKGTQLIGERLAEDVVVAMKNERPVNPIPVLAASRTVRLPLQTFSPEELEQARGLVEKPNPPFLELVRAHKVLALKRINAECLDAEIQAFRVGDIVIVGLPGELFVELGLSIKKNSPFPTTIVVELANDAIHYVPTRKAFSEGSYEVVNSLIAPGGGELMVETALGLVRQLREE